MNVGAGLANLLDMLATVTILRATDGFVKNPILVQLEICVIWFYSKERPDAEILASHYVFRGVGCR